MKNLLLVAFLSVTISGFGQLSEGLIQAPYQVSEKVAEGHPFLFEEFNSGNLKITTGNKETIMIRYNLAENNLLASLNGKEYILKKEMIEGFTLSKAGDKNYNFVPLRIGTKQYFVEELFNDNTIKFVKWHRKVLKKGQPVSGMAGYAQENSPDRFVEVFTYMFVIEGQVTEYTLKKDDLLEVISNQKVELKDFLAKTMKEQKLKAKDERDVLALLQARKDYLSK